MQGCLLKEFFSLIMTNCPSVISHASKQSEKSRNARKRSTRLPAVMKIVSIDLCEWTYIQKYILSLNTAFKLMYFNCNVVRVVGACF